MLNTPLAVQEAFGQGHALPSAPWNPAPTIPVRMVAGPLFSGSVKEAKDDKTGWTVTVADKLPEGSRTGYAVLVVDGRGKNHGILLFDGTAIPGAIKIGTVAMADSTLPLLGVRMSSALLRDPKCPLFGSATE